MRKPVMVLQLDYLVNYKIPVKPFISHEDSLYSSHSFQMGERHIRENSHKV